MLVVQSVAMMEQLTLPRTKKPKRSAPLCRITAEEFSEDMYADGVLFCRFCAHSVDYTRSDTVKDHIKSKKHLANKEAKRRDASSSTRQTTLGAMMKSKDLRESFVLDFVKMCTVADIPLEKTEKVRPFLQKYCQQAGALPQAATLRTTYVPRLFEAHFSALLDLLRDKPVSIIADETTDVRDHSILNVIATVKGKPYLIGVVKMEACNHSTYSQAILSCASEAGISFQNVTSIVSDSASLLQEGI